MKRLLFICLTGGILSANAQSETAVRLITLAEAIRLARVQSVDAIVALNELKTAYWEYRTYRANLLPEVNFDSTIPSYHKNYDAYQQENGDYKYLRNDYMQLKGNLSIDQHIWLTGGTLSLNTSLDYLKLFGGKKAESYMTIPVAVRLNQPIFGVNAVKWSRRIEPVRYKEAKAAFLSATEEVTMTTITGFFDLLLAKEKVIICKQNLTNADLVQMIREHTFREDLYYRINLITVHLPALRERKSDIPLLVDHFVKRQCRENGLPPVEVTAEAMAYLARLPYPGNVRELKNLVERTLLIAAKNRLEASDFEAQQQADALSQTEKNASRMNLEEVEKQTILQALQHYRYNITRVASALGISRQALYRRLEKYGIRIDDSQV